MLKCSQSEGFWFDLLSILNVKINKTTGPIKEKNKVNFKLLADEIAKQIGTSKFNKIFQSDEYIDLYNVNSALFELVDKAKKDTGLAKKTDSMVFERWKKKEVYDKD